MFAKQSVFDWIRLFFRLLIGLLLTSVFVIFAWRMITARVPKELKVLSPNSVLQAAYDTYGDSLTLFGQEQNTITRGEKDYGYFSAEDCVFIKEAGQIQLLIRYNDSTLAGLKKDYALDFEPDREKDWYDITLVVSTDLTPDNAEDNLSNDPESVSLTRIKPSFVSASVHEGRYSYRRLVFDGIGMDDNLLAVYADFYYLGDVAYEKADFDMVSTRAYATLCLYAYTEDTFPVSLTKDDLAILKG